MTKLRKMTPNVKEGWSGGICKYEATMTPNSLWEPIDDRSCFLVEALIPKSKGGSVRWIPVLKYNEAARKHNERLLKKWVLDDDERRYLQTVVRPLRKEIRCVVKYGSCSFVAKPYEYLILKMDGYYWDFPPFPKGKMYQGMKEGKEYTLEDLGL